MFHIISSRVSPLRSPLIKNFSNSLSSSAHLSITCKQAATCFLLDLAVPASQFQCLNRPEILFLNSNRSHVIKLLVKMLRQVRVSHAWLTSPTAHHRITQEKGHDAVAITSPTGAASHSLSVAQSKPQSFTHIAAQAYRRSVLMARLCIPSLAAAFLKEPTISGRCLPKKTGQSGTSLKC